MQGIYAIVDFDLEEQKKYDKWLLTLTILT
jgi:hypothetical protein